MAEVTLDRVRAWLKLGLQGPWSIDERGMVCDVRGTPFMRVWPEGGGLNAHDFAAATPDIARAYIAEHARAEAAEAERDRLAALTQAQAVRLCELEREKETAFITAGLETTPTLNDASRLVFSARQALARTAPAADPKTGAPVSLGWRIRWLCERVAELEAAAAPVDRKERLDRIADREHQQWAASRGLGAASDAEEVADVE